MNSAQRKSAPDMRRFGELVTENHCACVSDNQHTRLVACAPVPGENLIKPEVQTKKKSQHLALTLWLCASVDHSSGFNCLTSAWATLTSSRRCSPACVPISPIRSRASSAPLRLVKSLSSPFSLSWRRAISPRAALTRKAAVDSPLIFSVSISSKTSWGMRIDICLDLSLLVFDAMETSINHLCDSVYIILNHNKCLHCDFVYYNLNHTLSTDKSQQDHRNSEARQCVNTNRASDHKTLLGVTLWLIHSISNHELFLNRYPPPTSREEAPMTNLPHDYYVSLLKMLLKKGTPAEKYYLAQLLEREAMNIAGVNQSVFDAKTNLVVKVITGGSS